MDYGSQVGQVFTTKIAVSTKAVRACANVQNRQGRTTLEINNVAGTSTVFFGDKDVTVGTGIAIAAGSTRVIPVNNSADIYLIASAATSVVIAEYTP